MDNQIQDTLTSFRRPSAGYTVIIPAAACAAFLALGLATAIAVQAWGITAVLLAAASSVAAFAYLNWGGLRGLVGDTATVLKPAVAPPTLQKQSLNVEIEELARALGAGEEQRTEMLLSYIVAEDLALRQIQQEQNLPVMRHVSIGNIAFDAVAMQPNLIIGIEVTFLAIPEIRQEKIDAMLRKAGKVREEMARTGITKDVRLMILLVTQLTPEDEAALRSSLGKHRFENTPVDIDIRLLDFETLQLSYITD